MRKFSKLVLALVAVVSFLCFLFYKVQYDKLRSVLQVLEFFGSANSSSSLDDYSTSTLVSGLLPTWRIVTSQFFVYSAFCDGSGGGGGGDCEKVTALAAVGNSNGEIGCKLWYEGTVRPYDGIFSSAPLRNDVAAEDESSSLKPFLATCESKFPALKPFGVSFVSGGGEDRDGFVHVSAAGDGRRKKKSVAACVGPQATLRDSTRMLTEQILLQQYFQVDDFLVYDGGLTDGFVSVLAAKQSDDRGFGVRVLPWNLPPGVDGPSSSILARTDCQLRTGRRFDATAFLKPGQVLVPRSRKEAFLANLLKKVAGGGRNAGRVDVPVRKFCAEAPFDDVKLDFSINPLRMSLYDEGSSDNEPKVSLSLGSGRGSEVVEADPDDLLVHDYSACGNYAIDDNDDERVDRFLTDQAKQIQLKIGRYFPKA